MSPLGLKKIIISYTKINKHQALLDAIITRQRPTLPQSCPCSTIGAFKLNLRVRYGNGCDPGAIATGLSRQPKSMILCWSLMQTVYCLYIPLVYTMYSNQVKPSTN